MTTLAHPFRLDANGRAATLRSGSGQHAAQTAGHVCSTAAGERPLAPLFGLPDQIGGQVDANEIALALEVCAPEIVADGITVDDNNDGTVTVALTVDWADTDNDQQED